MGGDLAADDEERRPSLRVGERLEHQRSARGVWTVVESESQARHLASLPAARGVLTRAELSREKPELHPSGPSPFGR
jgi:hypothetical protein